MNWPVDLKKYNDKIKKYILNAVETGEIIRTKGKGVSGKFTVPGLKVKKKKRKNKLGKAFDEVGKVKILKTCSYQGPSSALQLALQGLRLFAQP